MTEGMVRPPLQGTSIFLVDDHPAVREGLQLLLSRQGVTVCGEAGDAAEALARLVHLQPDLVLVDLSLGGESGLALLERLHAEEMRTLVYTMHDEPWHIRASLVAGARGYVTKREPTDILREGIAAVLAGETYLSPVARQALPSGDSADPSPASLELLSPREREIFRLAGEGFSPADMAERLAISVSTVETNFARIVTKLGLSGTRELRRLAISRRTV